MIVDTRDAVFGGEQLLPSRGIWFEDITDNQPAYFVPRRGNVSVREREEITPPPAVRQRLTVPEGGQQQISGSGNRNNISATQPSDTSQQAVVLDKERMTALYFTCPLCQKILTEPCVLTGCMHRFCRICIESWFGLEMAKMCPTCGLEYSPSNDVSQYLCRDQMYEAMIQEIFPSQEGGTPQNANNHHIGDVPHIQRKAMASSLSQGMKEYTKKFLQNRESRPIISLRAPTIIISLSFDHHTLNDWRYVACPLDKSIWQLKQVVAKHTQGRAFDIDSLARSLRFHLMLDVRLFPSSKRRDIVNALCSDHNMGIDDHLTFREILRVTGQPCPRPISHQYASSTRVSNGTNSNIDLSPVDDIGTCHMAEGNSDATGDRDISNRWPLFLKHVSSCTFDPGSCPHGETCDMMKSLGAHIQTCDAEECTYPRCQPWRDLVRSHGADCSNSTCLVCTLRKVGSRGGQQVITARVPDTMQAANTEHALEQGPVFRELGGTLMFHVSRGT